MLSILDLLFSKYPIILSHLQLFYAIYVELVNAEMENVLVFITHVFLLEKRMLFEASPTTWPILLKFTSFHFKEEYLVSQILPFRRK